MGNILWVSALFWCSGLVSTLNRVICISIKLFFCVTGRVRLALNSTQVVCLVDLLSTRCRHSLPDMVERSPKGREKRSAGVKLVRPVVHILIVSRSSVGSDRIFVRCDVVNNLLVADDLKTFALVVRYGVFFLGGIQNQRVAKRMNFVRKWLQVFSVLGVTRSYC